MHQLLKATVLLLTLAVLAEPSPSLGQGIPEAPPVAAVEAPSDPPVAVGEVWPRLVYLLDKDGKPTIPYLDFQWEKFNLVDGVVEPRLEPNYLLTELHIAAKAEGQQLLLDVTIVVQSLVDGPQRIPIKLGDSHFQTQPATQDNTPVRARFLEEFGEYELLIDGRKDQEIEIKFSSVAPLHRIGEATRLRLTLPRALISSMELQVPGEQLLGQSSQDMTFRSEVADGLTAFHFDGLVSRFEFQWRPERRPAVKDSATFEVEGLMDVRVAATGIVTTDAQLTIIAFSKPLESVRVLLPEGTFWSAAETDSDAYTIVPLGDSGDGRRQLEILFAEASRTPPTIRLLVEADSPDNPDEMRYELAGFDVVDAASQFGQVNLYSIGDHRLSWETGDYAQRINTATGAKATFAYYQPHQLHLAISPQPREVMVEPLYVVTIGEGSATLRANFRCNTGGARMTELRIDLGPWNFEGLGKDPQNLISEAFELRAAAGRIELPLTAAPDEFEIGITATLPFANTLQVLGRDATLPPEDVLDLPFPTPAAVKTLLQSTVAVMTAPDVVVAPLRDTSGYTVINAPPRVLEEVGPAANPLCFRTRTVGTPAPLQLTAARLERLLSVTCDTDIVEVGAESLRVQQRMQWEVGNVQLPQALLTMPKRVFLAGRPQIAIDGRPTIFSRYFPTFGDDIFERYIVQVPLERMIGSFELTVTYDWAFGESSLDEVVLELVLPKRGTSTLAESMRFTNRLRRPRVQGYQISLSSSGNAEMDFAWTGSTDLAGLEPDIEAMSDELQPQIPLTITQVGEDIESTPFEELVEQSWYQTWYTNSDRTDRAVFRVRGADKTLRITMPEDTNFRKLHAWVDGEKVEFLREDSSTIALGVGPASSAHVIELWHASEQRPAPGVLETRVPVVEGADMLGQWYWHIVMPRNESLVSWPRSLTRAHRWDWSSLIPRVRSQLGQTELEHWSGAMQSKSNVLLGSNEYLFGAMGEPETLWVRTAPLPLYVLVVAGSILVFGLLLLQAKRHQRVGLLCIAGVMIAAAILVHPSYGAIAGQVVVLGTTLVVLASLLRWLLRSTTARSLRKARRVSTFVVEPAAPPAHAPSRLLPRSTTLSAERPTASGVE